MSWWSFWCRDMRSIDSSFYKTGAWKKCRAGYIKSVGGLCERCLAKGLIVPGYIVHHKIHLTQDNVMDPSITFNYDNLEYICFDCHQQEHFSAKPKRRYKIDENGTVIIG